MALKSLKLFVFIFILNSALSAVTIDSMFTRSSKTIFHPVISDAYGVSFRDINNDGCPDLYVVCFRNLNRLLICDPATHRFKDLTISSGLGGNLMPGRISNLELGTVIADFNNNQKMEVVISGWNNTTSFFTDKGNLNFRSYLYYMKMKFQHDFNAAITGDIDNDGDLDLFFTDEHFSNRLFINRGNAVFDEDTESRGLYFEGISQGASFADVDLDGDLDLYVANWDSIDLLYRNDGNGYFTDSHAKIEVCQKNISTNAITFADIDNDGALDFFVTSREGRNYLYLNQTLPEDTSWSFIDVTTDFDLMDTSISYGSVIADFNQDGWQDIFVTNIGANQFYLNQNGKNFNKIFEEKLNPNDKYRNYSTGAACADYDLDGDLDLFVSNKDTFCLLYKNPTNNKNFIKFKIHGIRSNRDAIGARVELYENNHLNDKNYLLGMRQISGGSGYLSLNDLVVHFGLDSIKAVDAKIIYPSKKIITLTNLQSGKLHHVYEYSDIVAAVILSYKFIILSVQQMEFWFYFLLITFFFGLTITFFRLGLNRYKWTAVTATGFVASYFFINLLIFLVLSTYDSLITLIAIDFVSIIYIILFVLFSERIRKLYLSRKQYRSVLIELINQIIEIRDDGELIKTVVESVAQNSNFNKVCIVLFSENPRSVTDLHCIGFNQDYQNIIQIIENNNQIYNLKNYVQKNTDTFISELDAEIIFPLIHNNTSAGLLILGTSKKDFKFNVEDIELYTSLSNQIAFTVENNAYIKKSNDLVKQLTESKVKEEYLTKLEQSNKILDSKNKELQTLYDELKNTQSQLIHSEKMSSLGQLVAGISHELNNPIGFMYSNSNQLQKYIDRIQLSMENTDEPNAELIKSIKNILPDINALTEDTLNGSKIVKELIDNLRRFSHLDKATKQQIDIHDGIESSLKIIHSQIKNRIEIHKSYQAKNQLECNPGQINQVILNILSNAAQSIKDKGNIWIETGEENDYLFIIIRDDGCGISQKHLKNIFDPFFTTKPVGEGTGLGLSISYSIIKNHGGNIEVESQLNHGTVFKIYLPLTSESR